MRKKKRNEQKKKKKIEKCFLSNFIIFYFILFFLLFIILKKKKQTDMALNVQSLRINLETSLWFSNLKIITSSSFTQDFSTNKITLHGKNKLKSKY